MSLKILVGSEPYLKDQFILEHAGEDTIERTHQFLQDEFMKLKQVSFFGGTTLVVSGNLNKESEAYLQSVLELVEVASNKLIFMPEDYDKRKKIFKLEHAIVKCDKLTKTACIALLTKEAELNYAKASGAVLEYLVDYSEYLESDSISLYDLLGVVRGCEGSTLTTEHIDAVFCRPDKDNAFKMIELMNQKAALADYIQRLSVHPQAMIGALTYALRIMAKLKISTDIGISSYQMGQYLPLAERYTLKNLVDKLEALAALKHSYAPKEAQKSLIFSILIQ